MKLVVTFEPLPGTECAPYNSTVGVEYESPEAFLVHLDDRLKTYLTLQAEYDEAEGDWYRREPRKKETPSWYAWYDRRPKGVEQVIDVGGYKFYAYDIVYCGEYVLPKVQTLDEWFVEAEVRARS